MKKILSLVRRCADDYKMIEENDKIAVGLSGGKDSILLLFALAKLLEFYPIKFGLEAVTVDLGFTTQDFGETSKFCESIGLKHTIVKTNIKNIVFDIRKEQNPCALCSKLRKGTLNNTALELGCNKIALGHNYDDMVETFMMSLIYEGRLKCFSPVTYLDRKKITMIRPLIYIPEKTVLSAVGRLSLPVVKNPCPANGNTTRQKVKELLSTLEKENSGIKKRISGAIMRYPLEGFKKGRP